MYSPSSYSTDYDGGSDFVLSFVLPRKKEIMVVPSVVFHEVEDIGFSYTVEGKIISFQKEVDVSSLEVKDMVVLEVSSQQRRLI